MSAAASRPRRRRSYFLEAPLRRPGLVVAPVVFLALAAAAVAHLLPPRYRASVLVRAEWEVSDEALLRQRGIDVASRRTQAVRQRATERALLQRVLREGGAPYATGRAAPSLDEATERLLSDLRVRSMASSSFVIEVVHGDAATAARVVNLLAHSLARGQGDAAPGDERAQLAARLEEARRTLEQTADALDLPVPAGSPPRHKADESDAVPPDEEAEIEDLGAREAQLEARTAPPGSLRSQARHSAPSPPADPARDRAVGEHQRAQDAYQALVAEWQAAQAALTAARRSRGPITRFELLREATVPAAQESPQPVLFVLAGAFAGLLTGLVAAVVAEHRDRRVKGPEDLTAILAVPLLATLPEVRTRDRR